MVIALGKLSVLSKEAVLTEVILSGGANAVPSPISKGQNQLGQLGIVGIYCSTLSHGHVMRGIEGAGSDISPGSGELCFSVNGVTTA